MPRELSPYLERLQTLPFVRSVSVEKEQAEVGGERVDALLRIKTPTGTERLYCEVKTSNLSQEQAARLVAMGRRVKPLLVASPVIGAGVGDFLAANAVCFLDLRGNCYVDLGGRYVARIEGKRGEPPVVSGPARLPAYQVLFTVLADTTLLSATVRKLAEMAGVSRQPAMSQRERLVELGYAVRGPRGYAWAPQGTKRAMDLWLAAYATIVRPKLLVGRYRAAEADLDALEARIAPILTASCPWRWGGGAAANRLTRYFRGEKMIVHVLEPPTDLPKRLHVVPDRGGPLMLLRPPGPAGMAGSTPDTAHPLLVYSELLADGSERAREAAELLAKKFALGGAT